MQQTETLSASIAVTRLKSKLLHEKNRIKAVSDFKYSSSYPEIYGVAMDPSIRETDLLDLFFGVPLPRLYDQLHSGKNLYYEESLLKELNWITVAVKTYESEIQRLLLLKQQFERELFLGKYPAAKKTLDQVKNQFGVSIWFIEQFLLVAELAEGLEANKRRLSEINNGQNNAIVTILANYLSVRPEKNISVEKYEATLDKFRGEYDSSYDSIINYLLLKLHPFKPGFPN